MASFTHHQRIAANGTKSRGSLFTAKGAGNLLLKLNHPEVVFSEIVGKRPSMSEAGIARKVRLLTGQINAVELACQAYLFGWTRNRKVVTEKELYQ